MNSNNQKGEKPILQGQRIKTRKRDEKEKHDPGGFRDSILNAIAEIIIAPTAAGDKLSSSHSPSDNSNKTSPDSESAPKTVLDPTEPEKSNEQAPANGSPSPPLGLVTKGRLDALSKFLDERGSKKDDYRKYGEVLFDVLIAGGILAPGGNIIDSEAGRTEFCVFCCTDEDDIKGFAQVFLKLIRRYKYLEKTLEDEFKKILKFLKGFTPDERLKLAKLTGILIAGNQIPAIVLTSAIHDQSVRDGCAGQFLVHTLQTWLKEKDKSTVWSGIRKAGLDQKIFDFFPQNKRTPQELEQVFLDNGLGPLLEYQRAGMSDRAKKELQSQLGDLMKESANNKEIIAAVHESMHKHNLAGHEVVVLLWNTLMMAMEWSKKEEMVADQAIRHLKCYVPVLKEFTEGAPKTQVALINRIQEFSYEYINFLKVFIKVIQLFYKLEVIEEDAILKWYREAHSSKGKSIFLEQAKGLVEWLETAPEESDQDE